MSPANDEETLMTHAEPFEARRLPELPVDDPVYRDAALELVVAVNGSPYSGDRIDAITYTLRWLRANPETARVLLETS